MASSRDSGANWEILTGERLEAWHVNALLEQKAACLVIPRFLSGDWCDEITRRFSRFSAAHPTHRVRLQPTPELDLTLETVIFPLSFFAQSRPVNLEPYFAGVERDRPALRTLYEGGADPLELIRAAWKDIGWTELPASEPGQPPFHTDLLWGMSGRYNSAPHVDTFHANLPGPLSHYTSRLNFDIFVRAPASSVSYRFYDRMRGAEATATEALAQCRALEHVVTQGDLIVYNASQYYELRSPEETSLRLLAGTAAGIDALAREYSLFA